MGVLDDRMVLVVGEGLHAGGPTQLQMGRVLPDPGRLAAFETRQPSSGRTSVAEHDSMQRTWHLQPGDGACGERKTLFLQVYAQTHGDPHIGHRPSDDAALTRWASAQRAARSGGHLADDRSAADVRLCSAHPATDRLWSRR